MAPADDQGRYRSVRNVDVIAEGHKPGAVPWPTDSTVDQLIWFAGNAADVWMPTPAERALLAADALERNRERALKANRRNRAVLV